MGLIFLPVFNKGVNGIRYTETGIPQFGSRPQFTFRDEQHAHVFYSKSVMPEGKSCESLKTNKMLVEQGIVFYLQPPATSRSPINQNGTMTRDALLLGKFISTGCVR